MMIKGCRGRYNSQNTYKYRLIEKEKEYLDKVGVDY